MRLQEHFNTQPQINRKSTERVFFCNALMLKYTRTAHNLFSVAKNSQNDSYYCDPSLQILLQEERVLVNDSSHHGSFTPSPLTVPFSLSIHSDYCSLSLSLHRPPSVISPWICLSHSSKYRSRGPGVVGLMWQSKGRRSLWQLTSSLQGHL